MENSICADPFRSTGCVGLCGSMSKTCAGKRENEVVSRACKQLALGKLESVINGPVHVGN
jgi:hypothetical protein